MQSDDLGDIRLLEAEAFQEQCARVFVHMGNLKTRIEDDVPINNGAFKRLQRMESLAKLLGDLSRSITANHDNPL